MRLLFKKSVMFLLCLMSIAACIAQADGSIEYEDDVDPILKQAPALRKFILNTLCISHSGMAVRIAGEYPMGGRRIGPYELYAKPKGVVGAYTMKIVINTSQLFFNKAKKSISINDIDQATRMRESLLSVEISMLKEPEAYWKSYNCTQ